MGNPASNPITADGADLSGLEVEAPPEVDLSGLEREKPKGFGEERDFGATETVGRWGQSLVEGMKEGVRWRARHFADQAAASELGTDFSEKRRKRMMSAPAFGEEPAQLREKMDQAPGDAIISEEEYRRRLSPSEREGRPEAASDQDWQGTYLSMQLPDDRARLLADIDARIGAGEPEDVARYGAVKDDYEARRLRQLEAWASIRDASFLQVDPDFDGVTSGYVENVLRSGTSSLPGLLFSAANPAMGLYDIWAMSSGALSEQIERQAEARGIDVPLDRRVEAARIGAGASAPLEQIGDYFKIGGMFGRRGWMGVFGGLVSAGVGEAATEFLQNYPETVAVTWALNPDLKPEELWGHTQKVVADWDVFMDSVDQAGVGFGAGVLFAGAGQASGKVFDKFISTKQRAADQAKRDFMHDILTSEGEVDPAKAANFIRMIGLDPEEMTDKQVQGIVDQVRERILNQQTIESEEKNQLRSMLAADGSLPAHVQELYFNLWDGMAQVGVEQGLYNRPEEFYTQWIAGIQRSSYAEFAQRTEGEADPGAPLGVAESQLQLKTLDELDDVELVRRADGIRMVVDDGKAKQDIDAGEALADMSDRAARLEEVVKCLTS